VPPRRGKVNAKRAQLWERRRAAVGLRVRLLRYERGLTQEELAAAAGMSRNSLLWLENGQRSLLFDRLYDLADALGVDVSELMVSDP
jgi:transcriptional regulator with XRE-family HTH domain